MFRKLTTIALALTAAALFVAASAPSAFGHSGGGAPHPVYEGLELAATGPCEGLYRLKSSPELCTHGPDPVPSDAARSDALAALPTPAFTGRVQCDGDGTTGNRVQVLYVRRSNVADGYSTVVATLRQWASAADRIFRMSAAETAGERHVRFVHDASCVLSVLGVAIPATNDPKIAISFNSTVAELKKLGFNRSDRKYMIFLDASSTDACGWGNAPKDERTDSSNKTNFGPHYGLTYIRNGDGCAGRTAAHELMHNIGGVQNSAPHSTGMGHCTDRYDVMCPATQEGSVAPSIVCGDDAHKLMFDCNHDDYFHTNPPSGNYLASHWNTALNRFLVQDRQRASGFVRTDSATAAFSTPLEQGNSTGAVNTVYRDGFGNYRIVFPGLGTPGWVNFGTVNVTAYGPGTEYCNVETWSSDLADLIVKVHCWTSEGYPVDSRFLATFTRPVGNVGQFAYVWADKPLSASYTPWIYRQYNGTSSSARNTIVRLGTGSYEVRLPNLAGSGGTAKVTAYSTTTASCRVTSWFASGSDELVRVACSAPSGAPVDAQFTLTFARGIGILGVPGGKGAYLWANEPTSASYTPAPAFQWNSTGGVNTITRTGTGAYNVRLPQLRMGGNAQVTASSAAAKVPVPPARCKVSDMRSDRLGSLVSVRCFDPSGAPADVRFTLGFVG